MKIENLDQKILLGMVLAYIANYHNHNTSIPEELKIKPVINSITEKAATIEIYWTVSQLADETNFVEDKREFDTFTILKGEKIVKLQSYIDEILDRLTA